MVHAQHDWKTLNTLSTSLCAGCLLLCMSASAVTRYVDAKNITPAPPYTDWATAATNIQDAINLATAGDDIVVTNGSYTPISVSQALALHSVNGPTNTLINGGGVAR